MHAAPFKIDSSGRIERSDEVSLKHSVLKLQVQPLEGPCYDEMIEESAASIGRGEACLVRLTDRKASRRHAELVVLDGVWTLMDCGSHNGTFVNGVRLSEPRRLRAGDSLLVGQTTILVSFVPWLEATSGTSKMPRPAPPRDLGQRAERSRLCDSTERLDVRSAGRHEAPALDRHARPSDSTSHRAFPAR